MASSIKTFVGARDPMDCVFDGSAKARLKHLVWRRILNGERARMLSRSRPAPGSSRQAADALRASGIVVGTAGDFLGSEGLAALDATEAVVRGLVAGDEVQDILRAGRAQGKNKDYLIHLVDFLQPVAADHPLLRLALDERLLRTVADYLGMVPQLYSVGAWYNFPVDDEAKASQLWHRDPEDLKTVKAFIYLDDVGPKQGPFSYIPGTQPFGPDAATRPPHEHRRRILDDEMDRAIPRALWKACTGPARTMVIADTVGFHRGGNVEEGHRLLVTCTFTSGVPQEKRKLRLVGEPSWTPTTIQSLALGD